MEYEQPFDSEMLNKYENMVESGKKVYFDADQIESIAYGYEYKDAIQEALEAVDFGLSLHPNNSDLLLLKSRYLLYLDFIKESREILNTFPEDLNDAQIINVELLFAENKEEEAYKLIDRNLSKENVEEEFCCDLLPVLWGYCPNNKIEEIINRCLTMFPNNERLLQDLSSLYFEAERYEETLVIFKRILDLNPFNCEAWENTARIFLIKKDYDQAIEACDFAIAIDSTLTQIYYLKVECLMEKKEYELAVNTLKEYEVTTDDKASAYLMLGECYQQQELMQLSNDYFFKYLEINPKDSKVFFYIAYNYMDMGNTPMAREMALKAIEITPSDLEVRFILSEIYFIEENYMEAYNQLMYIYKIDPNYPDLLSRLGDVCIQIDKIEEAITYWEKAVENDKDNSVINARLSLAYLLTGNYEKSHSITSKIEMDGIKDDDNILKYLNEDGTINLSTNLTDLAKTLTVLFKKK
ncbi:MAG: tetratricopeptide repeat protein [Bacteroidales bacterium]|nr:tetratricopeptide repeat protein [Bacteroidales bacterium]